ncbi:MAG: antitoxin [Caulobacteraceae bacterium]
MSARAKLFTHGGSQAVRLPKAFRFEGKEVRVRKEGDAVILEPVHIENIPLSGKALWDYLDSFGNDFPDRPPQPKFRKTASW